MKETTTENIVRLAEELDQKQSWIKKGFAELLEKLNKSLEGYKTTTTDKQVEYLVRMWENEEGMERKVTLDLDVDKDGIAVVLRFGKEDYESSWDWETLKNPSLSTVRAIATKMPEILAYFVAELTKANDEEQETADALKAILGRLEA